MSCQVDNKCRHGALIEDCPVCSMNELIEKVVDENTIMKIALSTIASRQDNPDSFHSIIELAQQTLDRINQGRVGS